VLTCLLRAGNINGVTFGAVALSVLLLSYVVYRGEAVSEVDLKDLKVKMQQVEQVRQEVFAKAEAVQRLGEELAALGVWNGRTVTDLSGNSIKSKCCASVTRLPPCFGNLALVDCISHL